MLPSGQTKKVLMVAYFFPPVGGLAAAGSQRTLKFVKYLDQRWEPIVLTVRESSYESYFSLDSTLLQRVPTRVKIVRTGVIRWLTRLLEMKNALQAKLVRRGQPVIVEKSNEASRGGPLVTGRYQALKDIITGCFEIPDGEMGWFLPALAAGMRVIKKERIDAIYATGKPWTAHLIGVALKKFTGRPLVVDFRDPWLTNPFREDNSTFKNRVEGYLENKVVAEADLVITNTIALRDEFLERYPQYTPRKFLALLNGFDPEDFAGLMRNDTDQKKAQFVITHAGFLYGRRDPLRFLEALRLLIQNQRIDGRRVSVVFVGSVELPYDLAEYLRCQGLDQVVTLIPHVPYQKSLEHLKAADLLLLLQPGTETQVPSKLFEYIALGKPILAISPLRGATSRLIVEEYLGWTAEAEDVNAIASVIETLYSEWERGAKIHESNGRALEKFNVKNVAAVFSQKLNELVPESNTP